MSDLKVEPKIFKPQEGGQEAFVRSNVDVCFYGGVLNPQPLDSLVSTPNGFVKMGELKVGDIISDPMGGIQKVNFVIDKGVQDIVELSLQDGRKVKCAMSHRWLVKKTTGKIVDVSTNEIIENIDLGKSRKNKKHVNRLRIPMTSPVVFNDLYKNKRILHPYLIGCLIGDGCISAKNYRADFGTTDIEIVNNIKSLGYDIIKESRNDKSLHYCIKDKFVVEELKKIGLWGHLSYTKFIPDMYKYAPIEDRMELLRGLFDTDGHCTSPKNGRVGRVGYRTVSLQLAKDIQEVIWSIGGRCVIHETPACIRVQNGKNVNCATSYGLLVWTKDDRSLFTLERKKRNAISDADRKCKLYLSIMDYKILPKEPVRCINVSGNEHIYLTDGYVITKNCGKSFGAILSVAEWVKIPEFRAVFTRRNLGETKVGGGMLDDIQAVYGKFANVKESDSPRITFKSKAFIDLTHLADENPKKLMERVKGWQYDLVYLDELTSYDWSTFNTIITRNRGKAGIGSKIRGTTNPKKNHWLRIFLKHYIGVDGFIRPEMDRKVMYFYVTGETVDSVIWGESKEDVYRQCKIDIDRKLNAVNKGKEVFTYENLIKSFSFILGNISENKASLENNKDYIGSVAASGGKRGQILLEGNWNVDEDDDSEAPISFYKAREIKLADPQINGDRWITADLADTGKDNFVALVWDGFHIIDIVVLGHSTPQQNANTLQILGSKYNIPDTHIIFDGNNGAYINDYLPDAIPFISYSKTMGVYFRAFCTLKDECYDRVVYHVNEKGISFSDKVASKMYTHEKMKDEITVFDEFVEECSVVRFNEQGTGRKRLASKKEMNQMLGRGRSMDVLDPIAMRFLPVLQYQKGDELEKTSIKRNDRKTGETNLEIYNDSFWA